MDLTIRDWFAAHAMESLIVTQFAPLLAACDGNINEARETLAHSAYKLADAMLIERAKP